MGATERHTRTASSIRFSFCSFSDADDIGGKHFRHLLQTEAIANFHVSLCFTLNALEVVIIKLKLDRFPPAIIAGDEQIETNHHSQ